MANKVPQADIEELVSDSNFDAMVEKTLATEKGYKMFPQKFGGETNMGISKRRFPNEDIKNMTRDRAKALYRTHFYEAPGIHKIAYPDVAQKMFDFGVTSGPEDSVKLLQKTLNKLGANIAVDGLLGDKTLEELYNRKADEISDEFENGVLDHYRSIKSPKSYQKSWKRRAVQ